MEISTQAQVYVFLTTLYGGVIMGLIYDIYRIFRFYSRPKRVKTFIEDIIFWIILSILVVSIVMYTNWGELRGYIFVGFLIGAIIYNKLLSKKIIRFISRIVNFVLKKLRRLMNFITIPIREAKNKAKQNYNKIKKYLKLPSIFYDNIKKNIRTIRMKK